MQTTNDFHSAQSRVDRQGPSTHFHQECSCSRILRTLQCVIMRSHPSLQILPYGCASNHCKTLPQSIINTLLSSTHATSFGVRSTIAYTPTIHQVCYCSLEGWSHCPRYLGEITRRVIACKSRRCEIEGHLIKVPS